MLNYEEQLEHLDMLIVSIQRHHENEGQYEVKRRNLLEDNQKSVSSN